jgi:hypothetical protein
MDWERSSSDVRLIARGHPTGRLAASEISVRGGSMSHDEVSSDGPPHKGSRSVLMPHLEELLVVCTIYTGDAERATGLLSGVLPDIVARCDGDDRLACHRAAYRAAEADRTARRVPSGPRWEGVGRPPRLERALAALPFAARAATVLVDVAKLRYDDVADVIDVSSSDVARLVASGRRALRRSLAPDGRRGWARFVRGRR